MDSVTSDVFANKNYDSIILSLTLWYLVPLTFGQVGAVPLPLGKRPAQQGCAAGPVPLHLTRPRGCPLPLPLPQLSGSASLSLPNSHPSPSDLTRLHKGHPGTRTLPAAGWARPPPRSRSPSLVPTCSPRPVPGSRQPRCLVFFSPFLVIFTSLTLPLLACYLPLLQSAGSCHCLFNLT